MKVFQMLNELIIKLFTTENPSKMNVQKIPVYVNKNKYPFNK